MRQTNRWCIRHIVGLRVRQMGLEGFKEKWGETDSKVGVRATVLLTYCLRQLLGFSVYTDPEVYTQKHTSTVLCLHCNTSILQIETMQFTLYDCEGKKSHVLNDI